IEIECTMPTRIQSDVTAGPKSRSVTAATTSECALSNGKSYPVLPVIFERRNGKKAPRILAYCEIFKRNSKQKVDNLRDLTDINGEPSVLLTNYHKISIVHD
ncbi:hypothetical protein WA026_003357, partial [Henosepilachna vigintioctopunctata]